MKYDKINDIKVDGNGNIILQDVENSTITVNYNDLNEIEKIINKIGSDQAFMVKEIIASQEDFNKKILTAITNLQKRMDQRFVDNQAKETLAEIDDFLKKVAEKSVEATKKRILTLFDLLRSYEDELVVTEDPKRKLKYKREIEDIKNQIEIAKKELKEIKNKYSL